MGTMSDPEGKSFPCTVLSIRHPEDKDLDPSYHLWIDTSNDSWVVYQNFGSKWVKR